MMPPAAPFPHGLDGGKNLLISSGHDRFLYGAVWVDRDHEPGNVRSPLE